MSPYALRRPEPRASPPWRREPSTERRPPAVRRIRGHPRPSYGRALFVGLIISAGLHVLFLFFVQFFLSGEPDLGPATVAETDLTRDWMRAYDIVIGTAASPTIEEQLAARETPPPDREPEPGTPLRRPAEPGTAQPEPAVRRSAVERLRPHATDPRLWERSGPRLTPPTDEERMRARVLGRIESLNDSLALAEEERYRALDWTRTTADGKRYGISPEGIHLGGITIPGPVIAPPAGRRDEVLGRMNEWSEIQRQSEMSETRDVFQSRVRAIRERRDRERESGSGSRPPDGSDGGP